MSAVRLVELTNHTKDTDLLAEAPFSLDLMFGQSNLNVSLFRVISSAIIPSPPYGLFK